MPEERVSTSLLAQKLVTFYTGTKVQVLMPEERVSVKCAVEEALRAAENVKADVVEIVEVKRRLVALRTVGAMKAMGAERQVQKKKLRRLLAILVQILTPEALRDSANRCLTSSRTSWLSFAGMLLAELNLESPAGMLLVKLNLHRCLTSSSTSWLSFAGMLLAKLNF